MVRRWSYINNINKSSFWPYQTFVRIGSEVIFKETTIFKKKRAAASLIRRKAWGRRRHINQWLVYNNVLFDWAKDYLFGRKYLRVIMMRGLHRHSFYVYNVLFLLEKSSGFYSNFELLNYVTLTNRVTRYCVMRNAQNKDLYRFLKNSTALYCTLPDKSLLTSKLSPFSTTMVYPVGGRTVGDVPSRSSHLVNPLSLLHEFYLQAALNCYIEVYKILILLYLNQITQK